MKRHIQLAIFTVSVLFFVIRTIGTTEPISQAGDWRFEIAGKKLGTMSVGSGQLLVCGFDLLNPNPNGDRKHLI